MAVFACLLGLTACSSSKGKTSDSSAATSSSSASSSAASSSASSSPSSSAKSGPASIVLQAGDLPSGWKAVPYQADPADAKTQKALVACAGGKDTSADAVGEAHSDSFSEATVSVDSQATMYKSQAAVSADARLLKSAKIAGCHEKLVKAELVSNLPAKSKINTVRVTITPGAGSGPKNLAGIAKVKVDATVSGKRGVVYIYAAFITGPKTEAEVDIESIGAAVPAALASDLVTKVAQRADG